MTTIQECNAEVRRQVAEIDADVAMTRNMLAEPSPYSSVAARNHERSELSRHLVILLWMRGELLKAERRLAEEARVGAMENNDD